MLKFAHVRFITSALDGSEFPHLKGSRSGPLPEIALVGRSNVGKSSLLNALLGARIAKTSSTPGKTQRINFFLIDELLLLADLPGYGFSKAPAEEIERWSWSIDEYLNTRTTLRALLLLVDIRRGFGPQDRAMQEWAASKQIPLLVIFTKRDKLKAPEVKQIVSAQPEAIAFCKTNPQDRRILIDRLNELLK